MTTQAAAAGGGAVAANGAAAAAGAVAAVKKELSPTPDGKGSRGGTPAAVTADGRAGSKSTSPGAAAAAAAARATPESGAAADAAAPSPEDEEQRRLEDEILAEGQAIAGVRALLAAAFSRPADEPAAPAGHWTFLLQEMEWLSNDMAQERLWKQAAAVAIGYEVARLRGKFGLRPPPEGQRGAHDEIVAARAAAAREAGERTSGRRSAAAKAAAESNSAAALKLDPADDPVFADLEGFQELSVAAVGSAAAPPATPKASDPAAALSLVFQHDGLFQAALEAQLLEADVERRMREEIAAREYRFEYEAALASHHMAVQEQNRRAMRLDADMADAEGLGPMDEDLADEDDYAGKKAKNRKRQRPGGYLLDDFASLGAAVAPDETESVGVGAPKQKAASRQYIEDTYLQRKRRRERYKDVDVDYDVGMESAGRYGTRANRALANRAGASRAQDPSKRKQALARVEGYPAAGGAGMARGGARLPPPGVPGPVIWSKVEDDLLLAITHEFGVNWTMVSEVLSLSLSMQGIFRPAHLCKQRFRQITTPMLQQQAAQAAPPGAEPPAVDYSEEKALLALHMHMTKQQARELIVLSLPVHDDVMMRMLEALVQVGATAKQRRQMEEKRGSEAARKMQEPHPSHAVVHQAVMAKTGGKHPSPMELAVQVDVAYAQQAKQHQMLAHQAQQAAQLQAQQAAAPPPPGQQAAAGAAGGGGGPSPGQQAGPGGGPGPAQGLPAAAQGLAAGTPSAPPGLVGPPPQQQQQQQQHSLPGSATPPLPVGTPGLVAGSSLPAQGQGGTPGPQGQLPPPAGVQGQPAPGPRPGQPQITLQQLNHILETGKLPNGQPLEAGMRKAIEDKRAAYLAQMSAMQQQRQMQMQQQMAAQAGAAQAQAPQPSSATQAALHAAQQAAAVQAGMRPPMNMHQAMFRPTMPGMPAGGAMGHPGGMPGQPAMGSMGMQAGMQAGMQQQMMAAQMAAANPGMQPGMQLNPAAQQQLIAQQFAMQQQAAAAAAQQQAAAAAAAQQPGAGQQG